MGAGVQVKRSVKTAPGVKSYINLEPAGSTHAPKTADFCFPRGAKTPNERGDRQATIDFHERKAKGCKAYNEGLQRTGYNLCGWSAGSRAIPVRGLFKSPRDVG